MSRSTPQDLLRLYSLWERSKSPLAARVLERRGVISGYEGSKPRQVLIGESDLPRFLAAAAGESPEPQDVALPGVDGLTEELESEPDAADTVVMSASEQERP